MAAFLSSEDLTDSDYDEDVGDFDDFLHDVNDDGLSDDLEDMDNDIEYEMPQGKRYFKKQGRKQRDFWPPNYDELVDIGRNILMGKRQLQTANLRPNFESNDTWENEMERGVYPHVIQNDADEPIYSRDFQGYSPKPHGYQGAQNEQYQMFNFGEPEPGR